MTDNTLTKIKQDKKTKNVPQNTTQDIKEIEQKEQLSTKCSSVVLLLSDTNIIIYMEIALDTVYVNQ
jgi:hypothetical protein